VDLAPAETACLSSEWLRASTSDWPRALKTFRGLRAFFLGRRQFAVDLHDAGFSGDTFGIRLLHLDVDDLKLAVGADLLVVERRLLVSDREQALLGVVDRVLGPLDRGESGFDTRHHFAFALLELGEALVDRLFALLEFLDLATGGEEAASAASAFHPGAARHFAVEGHDGRVVRLGDRERVFESADDESVAESLLDRLAAGQADRIEVAEAAEDAGIGRRSERRAGPRLTAEDEERGAAFAGRGQALDTRARGLRVRHDESLQRVAEKAFDRLLMLRRHFDRVGEDADDTGSRAIVEKRAHTRVKGAVGGHKLFERCPTARELVSLAVQRVEFAAEIPALGLGFLPVLPRDAESFREGRLGRLALLTTGRVRDERRVDALAFAGHFIELGAKLRERRLRALDALVGGGAGRAEGGDAGESRELRGANDLHLLLDRAQCGDGLLEESLDAVERRLRLRALGCESEDVGFLLGEGFRERREAAFQILGFLQGGLRAREGVTRLVAAILRVGFELVGLEREVGVLGADGLEGLLLLEHGEAAGFELGLGGRDGGVDPLGLLRFRLAAFGEGVRVRLELGERASEDDALEAELLLGEDHAPPGLRGLALQGFELLLDLGDDVVHAQQVLLGGIELELGLATTRAVLGDARGFLDEGAAVGRLVREDLADLALLDEGVRLRTEAGVHEQLVDVLQPAGGAVHQVLALAVAVEAARDRALVLALGTAPVETGELEVHLGHADRLTGGRTREDDVGHGPAAEALGTLFAEDPGDGVRDVALAAPVRADDPGHTTLERQLLPIAERLKANDFNLIQTHHESEITPICCASRRL
jgi:hypothetical protein